MNLADIFDCYALVSVMQNTNWQQDAASEKNISQAIYEQLYNTIQ